MLLEQVFYISIFQIILNISLKGLFSISTASNLKVGSVGKRLMTFSFGFSLASYSP